MEKKISVVMPVYNGGDLLIRTLDSLSRQTYQNIEMIVVDDGSTDDTALRLAQYAEKEPRLHPFTVPNGGPARARNFGIRQTSGDYLYLCDADDLPEPVLLERLAAEMDTGVQLAACGFIEEKEENGAVIASTPFTAPAMRCSTGTEFLKALPELMLAQLMYVNWNKMYRLDIVRSKNIEFPEKYASCEDRLFNLAYFPFVQQFSMLEEPLFHYYVRGDASLVSKFLPSKYESLECFDGVLSTLYQTNGLLTEEVMGVNARIFIKGAVACLISLRHPSCKLTATEKKGYIHEMLESDSMKNALAHLNGGIHFKVIGMILRTKSTALASGLGGMSSFAVKRLPKLLGKLKRRK